MRSLSSANIQQLEVCYQRRNWLAGRAALLERAQRLGEVTMSLLRRRGTADSLNRHPAKESFLCLRSDIEMRVMLAELHYPPARLSDDGGKTWETNWIYDGERLSE